MKKKKSSSVRKASTKVTEKKFLPLSKEEICSFDIRAITFFKKISIPLSRFGLFVIFFWFGILKVFGLSAATPLVQSLFEQTIGFMPFPLFLIFFGMLEMAIGVLFLIRGAERVVIPLMFLHMMTTFLPLFLLREVTWNGFLVPTVEGQYIIKNIVVIASAIVIAAHLHPMKAEKVLA